MFIIIDVTYGDLLKNCTFKKKSVNQQIGSYSIKQVPALHNKASHSVSANKPYKRIFIRHFNVFLSFKFLQLRVKHCILQKKICAIKIWKYVENISIYFLFLMFQK